MLTKNCLVCGKEYSVTNYRKETAHFCCIGCSNEFKKGKPNNSSTKFKKGHKNGLGKKRSLEVVEKMRPTMFKKGLIPWNTGKHPSSDTIKKMSISARKPKPWMQGEKSRFWKGGVTKLRPLIHQSFEYRDWRRKIFERDKYSCQICEVIGVELNADHYKKSFSEIIRNNNIVCLEDAKNCLELWDINNGRTLCLSCHKATDNYGGKSNKRK